MLSKPKQLLSLTACTGLLLLASTPMAASAQEAAAPEAQTTVSSEQFSDELIRAFATSALEIISIQKEMVPQIQTAKVKEDKQKIFQDMRTQMMTAVENNENITVEEYNTISQAAENNPELASRIETQIQTMN